MNDYTPRKPETELTWSALGSQLRFYRLLLVTALSLLALHVTTGGWAQFLGDASPDVAALEPEAPIEPVAVASSQPEQPASPAPVHPMAHLPNGAKSVASETIHQPSPERPHRPRRRASRAERELQATVRMAGKQLGRGIALWQEERRASWQRTSEALGTSVAHRAAELLRRRERTSATVAASPVDTSAEAALPAPRPRSASPGLVLTNPPQTGGPVGYLLNGQQHTLRPGQSQRLARGDSWRIEFHRGSQFGNTAYTLKPGAYEFDVTPHGWELYPE